jgi:hypothetical protein
MHVPLLFLENKAIKMVKATKSLGTVHYLYPRGGGQNGGGGVM